MENRRDTEIYSITEFQNGAINSSPKVLFVIATFPFKGLSKQSEELCLFDHAV